MSDDFAAFNDNKTNEWVKKLRFSRSFLAKLILSDAKIKDYYAAIATELLSFNKVRSRPNWSGVTFLFGRTTVAKVSFVGKTLCLFLALDPADRQSGKYKLIDVGTKKTYSSTPSKFKIKSDGALKAALSLIGDLKEKFSFTLKDPPPDPVLAKNFPTDSINNLLTRGLIRRIVEVPKEVVIPVPTEQDELKPDILPDVSPEELPVLPAISDEIYTDTLKSNDELISRYDEYAQILKALDLGSISAKLYRRFMLKTIDETWVNVVEDSLPALDEVVRTPSHFIEETESILPIERTKKVTSRSIQHLSQHTDLISRIEKDNTVIPSKLLNVFRDDSIMTYENKFVNTLLNRLFIFVSKRYESALKNGANERITSLDFSNEFVHGSSKGKIRLEIELTDSPDGEEDVRNYAANTDLWRRVRKLNDIARNYQGSEFVLSMGRTFIRPPVVRTNPILKNKNLRQCLALWEFIESYDDKTGILVDETEHDISDEHLKSICQAVAQQYLVFRRNIDVCTEDKGLPRELSDDAEKIKAPQIFDYTPENFDENAENQGESSPEELMFAIETALAADEIVMQNIEEKEKEEEEKARIEAEEKKKAEELARAEEKKIAEATLETESETPENEEDEGEDTEEQTTVLEKDGAIVKTIVRYRKSFAAKLRLAPDTVKEYYCAIRNKFTAKNKVSCRSSFSCETFSTGRSKLAKITVIGKTLRLYLALDPSELPPKYFVKDVSDVKKYASVPAMLKVKSGRGLKNTLELIDGMLKDLTDKKTPEFVAPTDFPAENIDKLVAQGLAFKTVQTFTLSEKRDGTDENEPIEKINLSPLRFKKIKNDDRQEDVEPTEEVKAPETEMTEEEKRALIENAKEKLQTIKNSPRNNKEKIEIPAESEIKTDSAGEEKTENNNELNIGAADETAKSDELKDAGGDPLVVKKGVADALSEITPEIEEKNEPEPEPEPVKSEPTVVPVGGDALTLKPITLEELENGGVSVKAKEPEKEPAPTETAEKPAPKKGLFSRLFGRKNK